MIQTPRAADDRAQERRRTIAPTELVRPEIRAGRPYRVVTDVGAGVKLDQNECARDLPAEIKRSAAEAFLANEWNRYPPDRPLELASRLAQKLDWPPDGLIIGRGSNDLILTLGLCLVSPGRRVVLPRPMFALFESVVRMHGGEVVHVEAEADFSHTAGAVIDAMRRSEAPVTAVCSPNNPTGHAFLHEELVAIADAAPGILILDEAYVEFQDGPTALDIARDRPHVLVVRTLSKAMGMAGLRVGYLAGDPALIAEIEKARLPFLIDRLAESVAIAMLERDDLVAQRVAEMVAERRRIVAVLEPRDDVEVLTSTANFFLLRAAMPPGALQAALLHHGVRVRSMAAYPELAGGPGPTGRFNTGWVRVSVGTPAENSDFLVALDRVLG